MTLVSMTVPDDPAALPGWLEDRLLAPDFGRLVAELSVHFATPAPPPELLDRWLPTALKHGLGGVPIDLLRQLLRNPTALADFQERVLTDGGAYWDGVADRSPALATPFTAGKYALDGLFAATPRPPEEPLAVPSGVAKPSAGRGWKVWAVVSTGVAACLAVMAGGLVLKSMEAVPVPKAQLAWGWGKPTGLAFDQNTPKGYLNALAAAAEEWSLDRPNDPTTLSVRLAEFRTGCSRLMHSAYGPLTDQDKEWLLARCREWGKKLDEHQQALDNGAKAADVRAAVDDTVKTITTTLREKAAQVG